MHLLIFDIDGTVANTYDVDTDCFESAITEIFRIENVDTNWSNYSHVTDSGILAEILDNHGIAATPDQLRSFKATFFDHLKIAYHNTPHKFSEIPGANKMISLLQESGDFQVAFASGGLKQTALFKLSKVGIDGTIFPAAFSDDSPLRSQIITCAIERAKLSADSFHKVTYVGDGIWDARACKEIGIPFIGRAVSDRASLLEAEGAIGVIPDFVNSKIFELLQ